MAYRDKCIIVPVNFYPAKSFNNYVHLGVLRKYRKGDTVVFPGESDPRVIYVVSGKLSLTFLDEDKQKLMYYAGPHCILDKCFPPIEMCLSIIVAEENSSVCFFSKETLFKIFKENDEILNEYITNLTSKCAFFMHINKEKALYSTTTRVLRFIIDLCRTRGRLVDNIYEIDIKLTQKTISEITGVHYVNVSKILGWLREEEILQKTPTKLIIYNFQRLQELTNLHTD